MLLHNELGGMRQEAGNKPAYFVMLSVAETSMMNSSNHRPLDVARGDRAEKRGAL